MSASSAPCSHITCMAAVERGPPFGARALSKLAKARSDGSDRRTAGQRSGRERPAILQLDALHEPHGRRVPERGLHAGEIDEPARPRRHVHVPHGRQRYAHRQRDARRRRSNACTVTSSGTSWAETVLVRTRTPRLLPRKYAPGAPKRADYSPRPSALDSHEQGMTAATLLRLFDRLGRLAARSRGLPPDSAAAPSTRCGSIAAGSCRSWTLSARSCRCRPGRTSGPHEP